MVLAAQTIPIVLILLLGGVIGDRWARRRIMNCVDALRFISQSAKRWR
ncbi:MFS transporter [Sphingomonas nostoxanthinifaciens]|nr:MFS transporter [Sphingomonas nostoxanthinifaciens]